MPSVIRKLVPAFLRRKMPAAAIAEERREKKGVPHFTRPLRSINHEMETALMSGLTLLSPPEISRIQIYAVGGDSTFQATTSGENCLVCLSARAAGNGAFLVKFTEGHNAQFLCQKEYVWFAPEKFAELAALLHSFGLSAADVRTNIALAMRRSETQLNRTGS